MVHTLARNLSRSTSPTEARTGVGRRALCNAEEEAPQEVRIVIGLDRLSPHVRQPEGE